LDLYSFFLLLSRQLALSSLVLEFLDFVALIDDGLDDVVAKREAHEHRLEGRARVLVADVVRIIYIGEASFELSFRQAVKSRAQTPLDRPPDESDGFIAKVSRARSPKCVDWPMPGEQDGNTVANVRTGFPG
jgi:hypothetical protein